MAEYSQRERITHYIGDRFGTEPEYLWADEPGFAVFRHPASKKWYSIIMDVPSSKLGLTGERLIDVMNVKCSPIMIGSLLMEKGFLPAYHMNKKSLDFYSAERFCSGRSDFSAVGIEL